MTLTTAAVLDALRPVEDPELRRSLVELNMIRDVAIAGDQVSFRLVLTTPACPLRELIVADCEKAVKALPGVASVAIEVGAEIPQQRSLPDRQGIGGVRNILAISSGKGGVGKSTVSVNTAVALAKAGARVGLLDADIYGPNTPTMLGVADAQPSVRPSPQGDILVPIETHGIKLVSMAFLIDPDQPVMWRGPMLNGIIRQFLYQTEWGELDYLIVDMPPGTGDAQLTLAQAVPLAGAVIVTTPQTVSLLDSRKGLRMFQQLKVPVLGIVENMSYFIPPDLPDRRYDIFGSGGGEKTAKELEVSLLGGIPLEIPLREGGDRGVPIVVSQPESASAQALTAIAQKIAAAVSVAALTQELGQES
ncbi:iron-sulfur cluster carrier protein ApbC [Synechococcus elongatus]|uniref:Iron-sulfur cluster carrier protein n=2 Tax=Synechococcus elongatus TaxID=32046 RepID=Q31P84_SYNE7|nr:iron-sulfur cluster carrier protein ApbC [Synechococcus elongatus]ABB57135.1 MRP protein-like [Synechococcus elongatus PCC 7942 = FACHB-805]AJD58349.1 sodium:proton antiporter [Synechococcus elongatus UTEX 2973]MBD2587536.1 iron-sulfur cluster carrier protein ApbC [Synechococcus elongatus FACHB-242]MBD2688685.1 iron-sulfur cluster carrier protein ApbC [Synechococcus elongatus FACHB-1061]MBD2707756.1 iron-sulfur cluster carrier protein ApbC [Synechococcus elongatus PCC 7942 = FACHB-805]